MKMELFYVVRPYKGTNDRIGRSADCDYISGPFATWNQAFREKSDRLYSDDYVVVKHELEVTE